MKKNWYAMVALVFFNVVFVLGLAIGVHALLASLWVIMGSFVLSPFLLFGVNFLKIQAFTIYQTLASFLLFAIGLALIPVCRKLTTLLVGMTVNYINYNKKLVYGESI